MKCNNAECMKLVLKNKDKFKGNCYCKNETCAYAGQGLGDTYMSFTLKHTGSGKRIKSLDLPVQFSFEHAQVDLDKYATKKKIKECIVNIILFQGGC